ncbi:MAG: GTPase HflX [Candidatus Zapsychrus exili]|nr:GTPase HflX [Candidatus Zapsychrus exili]
MSKISMDNTKQKEKVFLVVVDFKKQRNTWLSNDILKEMENLVTAADAKVVGGIIVSILKPSASHLIGEGKIEEIASLSSGVDADTIIFSQDIKASQKRNLEKELKARVIDRNQLILDIFARRATSAEGKMQVELAQLQYLLPRLTGRGVEMSRLGGGIGTLGPGETKLEIDKRLINSKISKLKKGLASVSLSRNLKRKKRKDTQVPAVALVGYTNAGKSTLLNLLTESDQVTKDGLFTTLDSLSRQFILPNKQHVILSDTVGFMHELPHDLIEAFKTTLEEVKQADVLLHVIDVSHPTFRNLRDSVIKVLDELQVLDKPIINVFNKIDKLEDKSWLESLEGNFENAVSTSAHTKEGVDNLLIEISEMLSALFIEINVDVPMNRMDLVGLAHQQGQVYSIKYYSDKINIRVAVPTSIIGKFTKI